MSRRSLPRSWGPAMEERSRRVIRDYRGRFVEGTSRAMPGGDAETERLARLDQLRAELAATVPFGYPTSGNPNIVGEHEVAPVRCPCCQSPLPWPLIKGWRD